MGQRPDAEGLGLVPARGLVRETQGLEACLEAASPALQPKRQEVSGLG